MVEYYNHGYAGQWAAKLSGCRVGRWDLNPFDSDTNVGGAGVGMGRVISGSIIEGDGLIIVNLEYDECMSSVCRHLEFLRSDGVKHSRETLV